MNSLRFGPRFQLFRNRSATNCVSFNRFLRFGRFATIGHADPIGIQTSRTIWLVYRSGTGIL